MALGCCGVQPDDGVCGLFYCPYGLPHRELVTLLRVYDHLASSGTVQGRCDV